MIIEEQEDGAVRGLLGTAFGAAEPPLRDFASGSIARGDAARRRNRWYAAGGAALSVVTAAGMFAAVAGGDGGRVTPGPAGVSSPKPTVTPDGQQAKGQPVDRSDKFEDIRLRLPGLLQPMLPAGVTIQLASSDYSPLNQNNFLLTGPSGTTLMSADGGKVEWSPGEDRTMGCLQKGGCDVRKVAGGTVYVNGGTYTAAEQAGDLKKALRPGSEKTVVGEDVWMMFVPDDRSKQYLQIREATTIAPLPYGDKAPAGWMGPWPPSAWGDMKFASDPKGVQLSADDFTALAAHAGIDQVETLLDPKTVPAPESVKKLADRTAQVAALLAPVLPDGVKPKVALDLRPDLILTGPSGQNQLRVSIMPRNQSPSAVPTGCPGTIRACDRRPVPGGLVLTWAGLPTDSNLHPTSDKPSNYEYWFLPDDTSQPAVQFSLTTNYMAQTSTGPLITADQFTTAAGKTHLVDIVTQVQNLLK